MQSPVPILQDCIDAITEHQRLCALVKGEWAKGLLPHSSVWADYTVQRIRGKLLFCYLLYGVFLLLQLIFILALINTLMYFICARITNYPLVKHFAELAEGTCVKNYEYAGSGDAYGKLNKKWTELPTDSHLLLYLFCAFLEHPKWLLHVDPTSHVGGQSSKNPLFLGVLPPKERFPEKYLAIISAVPSVIHPGACILAVGKQTRPVLALYWDKKPQFSLQASGS